MEESAHTDVSGGWNNRYMKKILLSLSLILGLSVPVSSPAHAIFGLSTCEKVKKKVLSYESKINSSADYWATYEGQKKGVKILAALEKYEKANWAGELVKLTYNNPKCFTRSQQDEINKRKKANLNSQNFVQWIRSPYVKNTSDCELRNLFGSVIERDPCFLSWGVNIYVVNSIESIYNF